MSPGPTDEEKAKAKRLRDKKASGETLTREEAGFLGAMGAIKSANEERRAAERAGKGEEYRREHQVESWTNAPGEARAPHLTEETEREVERIREKQERGETLTREEAGTLGGATRARGGGD